MLKIRDATHSDLPALLEVRKTPDLYSKYFDDSANGVALFLVCEEDGCIVGFGRLKLEGSPNLLRPLMSDLYVHASRRSQGIGSELIEEMESTAKGLGHETMFVGVDPVEAPRALELYKRLGYVPMHDEPRKSSATFEDESGNIAEKTYLRVDLSKSLRDS